MKVMCVGKDYSTRDRIQLAVRFRWPDAVFVEVPTPDEALTLIETEGVDLMVVLANPGNTGVPALCTDVRRFSDVPIMVVEDAAADYMMDEVKALEAGADEFVSTSTELPEFVARVAALIRRAQAQGAGASGSVIQCGDLLINPATYEAFLGSSRLELTATEFHLLVLLVRNTGTVVRHRMVERALWGDAVDSSALVKKYVHRLRRKLEDGGSDGHEFIRSVYSIGYLFVARDRERDAVPA